MISGSQSDKSSQLASHSALNAPWLAGAAAVAVVLAMHMAPRGDWLYLLVFGAVMFALLWHAGWRWRDASPPTPMATALLAFSALTLLGGLWGMVPALAIRSGAALLAQVGIAILTTDAIARLNGDITRRICIGLLAGFVVGSMFLLFEGLSGLLLERLFFTTFPGLIPKNQNHIVPVPGQLARIDVALLKRHMSQTALLLWPVCLVAMSTLPRPRGVMVAVGLVIISLFAGIVSQHNSSNLAIVTSLVAFAAAALSFRWTWRVVAALWVCMTLLVVPAMLWQYHAHLYQQSWIQPSGRHRLVIWGYSAEQVAKSPWLGIGAGSGQALDRERKDVDKVPGEIFDVRTANHQHDFYLQIWYEMGFAGALLVSIAGAICLRRIARLPPSVRNYALAGFVSVMFLVSTSYGIWQEWFQASIAMSAVMLTAAIRHVAPGAFDLPPPDRTS